MKIMDLTEFINALGATGPDQRPEKQTCVGRVQDASIRESIKVADKAGIALDIAVKAARAALLKLDAARADYDHKKAEMWQKIGEELPEVNDRGHFEVSRDTFDVFELQFAEELTHKDGAN